MLTQTPPGAPSGSALISSNCSLHTAFCCTGFLSPIANRRSDSYGGSLANRMRYLLEVAAATHEAWPRRKPLGMRITGCDWVEGGITTDESSLFASELGAIGSITSAFRQASSVRRRGPPWHPATRCRSPPGQKRPAVSRFRRSA
jgi:2,4-dienoyl-CoA reductase-like NADH-dependent reductase (Old Yellow Enzyme family)